MLTCAAQEIFIRGFIRKLHDALCQTSEICEFSMKKFFTIKSIRAFFIRKWRFFIKKGRVGESRLLYPKNRQFF